MRIVLCALVVSLLSLSTASPVDLPENWDRLTCKVITGDEVGTAFVIRYKGELIAVTNDHVVTPGSSAFHLKLRDEILTLTAGDSVDSYIAQNEAGLLKLVPNKHMYCTDSVYDIAFVRLKVAALTIDNAVIPESIIGNDSLVSPGREVFFLGYPNGWNGRTGHTPLVRSAIIAGDSAHKIILDGNFFGGSSGSPVLLNRTLVDDPGKPYLIGVVSEEGLRPARRAKGAPPIYAENIGIGFAVKIDYILARLDQWMATWE